MTKTRPQGAPLTETETADARVRRILDTRAALDRATATHLQAIRDADAAALPKTTIARALGISDRTGIYRALRAEEGAVTSPPVEPVVLLRADRVRKEIKKLMTEALWRRGYRVTISDHTAWLLASADVPVVLLDISENDQGDTPIYVGMIEARHVETTRRVPLTDLLSAEDVGRMMRVPGSTVLTDMVEHTTREEELWYTTDRRMRRPTRERPADGGYSRELDADRLAQLIGEILSEASVA